MQGSSFEHVVSITPAIAGARAIDNVVTALREGRPPKANAARALAAAYECADGGIQLRGDPVSDWQHARIVLTRAASWTRPPGRRGCCGSLGRRRSGLGVDRHLGRDPRLLRLFGPQALWPGR